MLSDFNFLDLLTQGGAITGSVFTDNTDFLGVLGLNDGWMRWKKVKVPFGLVKVKLCDRGEGKVRVRMGKLFM